MTIMTLSRTPSPFPLEACHQRVPDVIVMNLDEKDAKTGADIYYALLYEGSHRQCQSQPCGI